VTGEKIGSACPQQLSLVSLLLIIPERFSMTVTIPKHADRVEALLAKLDDHLVVLNDIAINELNINAKLFGLDLLAWAGCKRIHNASAALKLTVRSWNFLASAILLRTHLDTALRFYAAWLVDNPNKFADDFLAGREIRKMTDRYKKQMNDSYLRDRLAEKFPWITEVYTQTSSFIHFSDSHVAACFSKGSGDGQLSLSISEFDFDVPEERWTELVECFLNVTKIFHFYLSGWAETKRMTPAQLEAGRLNQK
jgi:hypothetical protein